MDIVTAGLENGHEDLIVTNESAPEFDAAEPTRDGTIPAAAPDETSPRTRWRDYPRSAQGDEREPDDAVERRRFRVAAGLGTAAVVIIGLSIVANWPEDEAVTPEVAGTIEGAAGPTPTVADSITSTTTPESVSESSQLALRASSDADLLAIASEVGELTIAAYAGEPARAENGFSFAVRIDNDSAIEVATSIITIQIVVDGTEIEDVEFVPAHDSIPPGESATGTVRVVLPDVDGEVRVAALIGDVVLGTTTIE